MAVVPMVETCARPALQPISRVAAVISTRRIAIAPLPPIIVNGVIFAAASGDHHAGNAADNNAEQTARSSPAVLYALDAATGKELWNSGRTMTSFAHGTGLSSSPGQVYLATSDGTVYAFGVPWERQ